MYVPLWVTCGATTHAPRDAKGRSRKPYLSFVRLSGNNVYGEKKRKNINSHSSTRRAPLIMALQRTYSPTPSHSKAARQSK